MRHLAHLLATLQQKTATSIHLVRTVSARLGRSAHIAHFFAKSGSLSRDRVEALKLDMLCVRNTRRQEAAKAELDRRGVVPRVVIGMGYVPASVVHQYAYTSVRGGA